MSEKNVRWLMVTRENKNSFYFLGFNLIYNLKDFKIKVLYNDQGHFDLQQPRQAEGEQVLSVLRKHK
jgi:hypothetical protein